MPRSDSKAQPRAAVPSDSSRGDETNRPVHTLRHRSIKATIWRNQTEKGPMYNVTIARSFRADDGQWRDSHSIGYDDLMNVAALMYEAHGYISSLLAREAAAARDGERR